MIQIIHQGIRKFTAISSHIERGCMKSSNHAMWAAPIKDVARGLGTLRQVKQLKPKVLHEGIGVPSPVSLMIYLDASCAARSDVLPTLSDCVKFS